jgi:hypothetical protein
MEVIEEDSENRRSIYRSPEGLLIRVEEGTKKMVADKLQLRYNTRLQNAMTTIMIFKQCVRAINLQYSVEVKDNVITMQFQPLEGMSLLNTMDHIRRTFLDTYHVPTYTEDVNE